MTIWIAADLETVEGRSTVYDAIKHMVSDSQLSSPSLHFNFIFIFSFQKTTNNIRFSIIHNPTTIPNDQSPTSIARAVYVAMETLPVGMAKNYVTKLVKEEHVEEIKSGIKTLEDLAVGVSEF